MPRGSDPIITKATDEWMKQAVLDGTPVDFGYDTNLWVCPILGALLRDKFLDQSMSIPFKSSPVEFNQHLLFPTNIFDLLPKGHECFLYADLFQQIDTSSLESLYSAKGQNAYPLFIRDDVWINCHLQACKTTSKVALESFDMLHTAC